MGQSHAAPSGKFLDDVASVVSEHACTALTTRRVLVEPGLRLAMVGICVAVLPSLIVLLAPLCVLLLPLLLTLGATLTVTGLVRAAVVVSFSSARTYVSGERSPAGARNRSGTLKELNIVTKERGEALVRQMTGVIRSNVQRATLDVRNEVDEQLSNLQHELQAWVGANANLRPYCEGQIGWLARQQTPEEAAELDCTDVFRQRYDLLPPVHQVLSRAALEQLPLPPHHAESGGWQGLRYLVVPGLLTKWYPLYMAQMRADFKRLGLTFELSGIDTDRPVRENAGRLRHDILELANGARRRVVLLCHSKGGCDAAAALALFPELVPVVAACVTIQAPHSGSAIAHDLANTDLQRNLAVGALEKLLRGSRHAVLDLSYDSRQAFIAQHPYPAADVPTLCVACCDKRPCSLLKPTINYLALRYGEWSDGCVCQVDATLPGCRAVFIDDMDHFGPAWRSMPATDTYDPTRLWLTCVSVAIGEV
tara:strand:+ start:198 stop:1637 length:1440 start_codon:yes stop_codon:yes gene_type:complete